MIVGKDYNYRISSKSRRGEILFQGSVWCGDNSRAARFRGRRLQRSIRTHVHIQSIALAFENCVFACVCVLRVRDMLGAQTKYLFNSSKNTVYTLSRSRA